jgi:peptidoglycan/LPS O-acetylase OafA/YrhL
MTTLRRALQAFAALFAVCGVTLLLVPGWVIPQGTSGGTFARITGAFAIGLAMLAVMVSRRDDAWWWAWAFAVVTALCGTVAAIHAVVDPPAGGALRWWLIAGVSAGLTIWLVLGLTQASQDHPIA